MKRQMIPAPMNEIAIGRKINDLAAFSARARSASTATARPEHGRQRRDHDDPPHVVEDRAPDRREDRARQDEEPGQDRTERARTALEGLARPPPGEHADEDAEGEQREGEVEEPAGEDVLPVVEVHRVLVGEDVLVVVPPDGLGAVAVVEREVDRADQRAQQPDADERQRRRDEDPGAGALIDAPSLPCVGLQRRARSGRRRSPRARRWRRRPHRSCRPRCRRRPRRRRASRRPTPVTTESGAHGAPIAPEADQPEQHRAAGDADQRACPSRAPDTPTRRGRRR